MSTSRVIDVIIPAFNEEKSIHKVVEEIPKDLVRHILVCNNASTDDTAKVASEAGATVVDAPTPGYGNACLAGMAHVAKLDPLPDAIVFLDGDHSDYPEQMPLLTSKLFDESQDLVIGSRALGELERGSMKPQQIFGNWLATTLIKLFYRYEFSDLGPFRAVRYDSLMKLEMQDRTYGWTVEMQVKAAKQGMACSEVAVDYRNRIGTSKVSGTVKGTILAGHKILWTIFKYL